MSGNIIDTNQYFHSFVLNDERKEQLFPDMIKRKKTKRGTKKDTRQKAEQSKIWDWNIQILLQDLCLRKKNIMSFIMPQTKQEKK